MSHLTFSPDGTKRARALPSRLDVSISDLEKRRSLYSLPGQNGAIVGLAWSPDSRRLAIGRSSGDLSIWGLNEVERILASLNLSP